MPTKLLCLWDVDMVIGIHFTMKLGIFRISKKILVS